MTLYRIAWTIGGESGHGQWQDAGKLRHLHALVSAMNNQYGPRSHRLEWKDVSAAAKMMSEVTT